MPDPATQRLVKVGAEGEARTSAAPSDQHNAKQTVNAARWVRSVQTGSAIAVIALLLPAFMHGGLPCGLRATGGSAAPPSLTAAMLATGAAARSASAARLRSLCQRRFQQRSSIFVSL